MSAEGRGRAPEPEQLIDSQLAKVTACENDAAGGAAVPGYSRSNGRMRDEYI